MCCSLDFWWQHCLLWIFVQWACCEPHFKGILFGIKKLKPSSSVPFGTCTFIFNNTFNVVIVSSLTVSHELCLPWTSWQICVSRSGSSSSPVPTFYTCAGKKNSIKIPPLNPPVVEIPLKAVQCSGLWGIMVWLQTLGLEHIEAGFGLIQGRMCLPRVLTFACSQLGKCVLGMVQVQVEQQMGRGEQWQYFSLFRFWRIRLKPLYERSRGLCEHSCIPCSQARCQGSIQFSPQQITEFGIDLIKPLLVLV